MSHDVRCHDQQSVVILSDTAYHSLQFTPVCVVSCVKMDYVLKYES